MQKLPSLRLALRVALALLAISPVALAQKRGGQWDSPKGAPSASAAPSSGAASTDTPTADPSASASASASSSAEPGAGGQKLVEPPKETSEDTDVEEKPGKSYYFIGARYRGTIVPQFIENLFVDGGRTIYTSTVGLEMDMRKDGFSFIPALSFTEYGMPDTLFLEKGKDANFAGNWSNIHSNVNGIYATADLLWSTKVAKNVDFEYGAGFGLGVLFGDLETSWVYSKTGGPYTTDDGRSFAPCITESDGVGCAKKDHQNAQTAKVNHYTEPSWANGGSKPNIFIHLAIPQFGLRFKPVKQMEARLGLGFSLTGFWFGVSANYGLEKALEKKN